MTLPVAGLNGGTPDHNNSLPFPTGTLHAAPIALGDASKDFIKGVESMSEIWFWIQSHGLTPSG